MRSIFILLLTTLFILGCSKDKSNSDSNKTITLSKQEIYDFITNEIQTKQKPFDWTTASNQLIYSAGIQSDGIFSIGYQPKDFTNIKDRIHEINVDDREWKDAKSKIESLILKMEESDKIGDQPIISPRKEVLPQIYAVIKNPKLIEELRKMPEVRFVEPLGYSLDPEASNRSSSGCSGDPNYNINTNDYTTLTPTTKRPWNFVNHNIPTAWSQGQGSGITVCVIDTGAGDNQDNLGSEFNSGNSTGRTVEKLSTHYSGALWWATLDPPNDPCGHGTSMCGIATAPWGNDGNAMGVAYKSNLLSIRAVEDVLINTSNERVGVKDALIIAGNRTAVKVVSMSIGSPLSSSTVADGIYYAYNKGKMLFAAGGTSFSWTTWFGVIFPAWMPECNAITGVKDGTANVKCDVCHQGAEIDFTVVMERAADANRNSIALALTTNQPKYIGGSSCATATAAGIAACMWSKNPNATRTQIFNAMRNTAQFYPTANSNLGWGRINASAAISSI